MTEMREAGMPVPRGRPLLGDYPARAGLVLAVCAGCVVTLGLLFAGQTRPDWFDNAVDSPLVTFSGGTFSGGRGTLLLWLAEPGGLIPAIAVSAAIAIGCLIARRPNGAVLAVAAVPAATGLDDALLKHLFHRTYLGQLSFPSGHTTSATALTATLAVLLLVPPQPAGTHKARVALIAAACVITAIVAAAVIGLRFHYFTDTMAGAAVGVGTVCALALLIDLAPAATRRTGNRADRTAMPTEQIGPVGSR
jgi:membrane-associated phospholipid phosphatase